MSRLNPGRLAALKALIAVDRGAHAEDELVRFAPPGGPDRGLAWHLCLGTLRVQGALDAHLQQFVQKPLRKVDVPVLCALRMGLYECTKSRTPSRAAVDQAVEGVRAVGLGRATGFVNAVMRKAIGKSVEFAPGKNLPPWLAARWSAHGDWLYRIQEPARINVAGTRPDETHASVAMIDGEPVPDMWQLGDRIGNVTSIPGFDEGEFWVMDPAAAHVVDILLARLDPTSSVLDACAAPGGKSFRIARCGHQVTAVDKDPRRIDRLRENCERLGLRLNIRQHDWMGPFDREIGIHDAVVVDAPCTALGTVRRHPEILWRRQMGDIYAMSIVQRRILQQASQHVKPGGYLLYAVCSTEPEEGIQVVESLNEWKILQQWSSVPPRGDEDAFQSFLLQQE